jgi:hypothetical protein
VTDTDSGSLSSEAEEESSDENATQDLRTPVRDSDSEYETDTDSSHTELTDPDGLHGDVSSDEELEKKASHSVHQRSLRMHMTPYSQHMRAAVTLPTPSHRVVHLHSLQYV